jgi:hypothetical protein
VRARVERLGIEHPANPAGVVTVTVVAIAAGFRHAGTKEMLAEMNDLLTAARSAGCNRVVWPR